MTNDFVFVGFTDSKNIDRSFAETHRMIVQNTMSETEAYRRANAILKIAYDSTTGTYSFANNFAIDASTKSL